MSYCSRCGTELEPGSAFCTACGAPVGGVSPEALAAPSGVPEAPPAGETPQAAPTPPHPGAPGPAYQAPPPGTPPRPPEAAPHVETGPSAPLPPPGTAKKKGGAGKAVLVLSLLLIAAGAAVVLILGFAVGPRWFAGGARGPEKTVEKFFQAMEKGDAEMLVELVDPAQLKRLKNEISDYYDTVEEMFEDYFTSTFPEGDLKVSGLEFKAEIKGDRAVVEVVKGTATYTDSYGDRVRETVDDPEEVFGDTEFNLRKVDGSWYLVPELE